MLFWLSVFPVFQVSARQFFKQTYVFSKLLDDDDRLKVFFQRRSADSSGIETVSKFGSQPGKTKALDASQSFQIFRGGSHRPGWTVYEASKTP